MIVVLFLFVVFFEIGNHVLNKGGNIDLGATLANIIIISTDTE